jgi:hypothetical protein
LEEASTTVNNVSNLSRKNEFRSKFVASVGAFEDICCKINHKKCRSCHIVSMQDVFKTENLCSSCAAGGQSNYNYTNMLPLWIDEKGEQQFHVPKVLSCLREGEKLLIQQVSVYVPLHHLMYGQLGARGHIVSFPQDITDVCKKLPRLPSDVSLVRVVKHFKLPDGEISSKSFSVRKQEVLQALRWLKEYNRLYKDIDIVEDNLN